jgi:flagellar basal-body rod modification protein FlgD
MSAINSSLSGTGSLSTTDAGLPSRFNELTSEDFVKIMFTELSNQDPLKPNDSNTLLQQFSSLRSIESNLTLEQKLGDVVTQNQLSTAGALLGKYVAGYTANFDPTQGTVTSISQTASGPLLNLSNGAQVPFTNIQQIDETPVTNTP